MNQNMNKVHQEPGCLVTLALCEPNSHWCTALTFPVEAKAEQLREAVLKIEELSEDEDSTEGYQLQHRAEPKSSIKNDTVVSLDFTIQASQWKAIFRVTGCMHNSGDCLAFLN